MTAGKEFYKLIKISGLVLYIPAILAAAPLSGYFLGEYLRKKFSLHGYVTLLFVGIGIATAARETVKVIRLAMKIERGNQR